MCARYTLVASPDEVKAYFRHETDDDFPPRANIAPSQPVAIVRRNARAKRELALVRWGLIPPWVKDPRAFTMLINARGESAAEKPSFRGAMRHRRCLVPASGFYEWTGPKGGRRPHLIRPRAGGLMALAGLWEHWQGADGGEIETMAILTVAANGTMSALHDRMPAILGREHFEAWLDCASGSSIEAADLLLPAPDELLEIVAVTPKLNSSLYDGPVMEEPMQRALF